MDMIISNSSGKPIYEQIADQIREQIMAGSLAAGEALPSMRLLARELRISVITTKRAYEELERAGFIYTVPGKGSFVAAKNEALLREEHLKKIEEYMTAITDLARGAGVSRGEVLEMWDLIWEEQT